MTVLKAKIGGQWVPIGGASDYARWNSAWGVVAVAPARTSQAEPVTFSAGGAYLTDPVTFTSLVGRRYRAVVAIRAVDPSSVSYYTKWTDGFNINNAIPGCGDAFWNYAAPTGTYGGSATAQWLFNGTGLTYNYAVLADTSLAGSVKVYHHSSRFYIEDIGPVSGAVPISNPTPAWITPTLLSPWTQRPSEPVQYRKVGDMVQLRGNPQGQAGYTVFYLPVGYRPPSYTRFSTISFATSEATASRGDISNSTGAVLPSVPNTSNAIWQLDGIQFSVTP